MSNIVEQSIREVCKQCLARNKAFEFMLWCTEEFPSDWQSKLKKNISRRGAENA